MEDTSKLPAVSNRDIFYYARRNQNRLFEALTSFFAAEAEKRGITKKDIAAAIRRDPAIITRLLSTPSNMTADTISMFLLALGAEMDYRVVRFEDRPASNYMHPLVARLGETKLIEDSRTTPKAKHFNTIQQPISTNAVIKEFSPQ